MYTHDRRKRLLCARRVIDIKDLLRVLPVSQVLYFFDIFRFCETSVPDLIIFFKQHPYAFRLDKHRVLMRGRPDGGQAHSGSGRQKRIPVFLFHFSSSQICLYKICSYKICAF